MVLNLINDIQKANTTKNNQQYSSKPLVLNLIRQMKLKITRNSRWIMLASFYPKH